MPGEGEGGGVESALRGHRPACFQRIYEKSLLSKQKAPRRWGKGAGALVPGNTLASPPGRDSPELPPHHSQTLPWLPSRPEGEPWSPLSSQWLWQK